MSFSSLFPTNIVFDAADVLICLVAALLLAVAYMFSGAYSKSMAVLLVIIPAVI